MATTDPQAAGEAARLIVEECDALAAMLLAKNAAYGNSALEPVRIFSRANPEEQIRVRIDDKLSRILRGSAAGEDVELDLLGYLVLLRVARRGRGAQISTGAAVAALGAERRVTHQGVAAEPERAPSVSTDADGALEGRDVATQQNAADGAGLLPGQGQGDATVPRLFPLPGYRDSPGSGTVEGDDGHVARQSPHPAVPYEGDGARVDLALGAALDLLDRLVLDLEADHASAVERRDPCRAGWAALAASDARGVIALIEPFARPVATPQEP
jgi:hypothetical protein